MDPDLGDGEAPRASSVGRTNSFLRLAGAPSLLMRSLSMRESRRRGNLAPIPEVDDKKNAARLAEMNKRSKTPDPKTLRNTKAAKSQARFYKDGSEYIGDLSKDGKRHGRGTMYNKDGRMIYDGEWKDDKMEGMGTYFYSDGSKYIGQWRQGKKHGEGTFHFAPRKRKSKLERASTEPGDKTGQDSSTPTLTTSRSAPIKPTESHDDVPESAATLKADSSTSSVTLPDDIKQQQQQQQQQEDSSGNSRGLPQSKSAPKWAADAHDIKRSTSLPLSPIKELPASTASSIATSSTAGTRGLPASLAPAEAEPLRVADFVDTEEEEERPRPGSKPRTSAQVLASLRMFQEPPEVPTLRPEKPLSNIPEVPETSMINMMEQDKPEPSGMGGAMQHAAEEQPHEDEANKGVPMYEEEEAMEEDDYGFEEEEEEDGKKGRRRKGKRSWSLGSLFSRHKKEKKKKDSEAASGPDKDAVKIEEDDGRIVYYKGSLWGHLRHGRGVLKDRAGNVLYDGEWAEDKKHGMGVCFYPDGSMYEGRFRQGVRHGDGTFYFADGGRYQGSWRHDMEDGQGICYLSDGTRYEGEWKEGDMHGKGTLFSTHGSALYRGAWVRGEPAKDLEPEGKEAASAIKEHGEQAVHVVDATKLRSQGQDATAALASHLLSGGAAATEDVRDRALAIAAQEEEGAMEMVQERKKKGKGGGLFARLLRRGKRRSSKDEEDEEEAERAESRGGEDEDSLEGARSAFAMRPDDVANGEAVGDVGVGRREYEDGSVYEGEVAAGMRHGHGVLRSLDGGVYRGCWRRDREEGAGVYVLPDGTRYEGEWHLGDMHGHGTMINRQGRVLFAGRWADNEPEAEGDASEAGRAARAAADQATSLVRKPMPPAAEEAGRRQQPQQQPAARPSERGLFGSSSRPISTEVSSRPAAAELPRPAVPAAVERVAEAVHEEVRAVEHKVAEEEAAAHEEGDSKPPTGGLLRSLSLRSSSLRGGMGRMLRQISIRGGDDDDDDEEPVAPQEAPVLPPKNGRGKHTYKDGSFYLGEFRDHKRHGYGKQTYPTGGHYEGQWKEDREDGQGTRFLADGSKYVGKWRNGEMHGQGTLFNSYGRVLYRGDWASGEPTDMLQ